MTANSFKQNYLSQFINTLKFWYAQRIKGFVVPQEPHFDPLCLKFFIDKLQSCNQYLEYGSGGSTFFAAKFGKDFIAIDSDKYFLTAIKKQIAHHGLAVSGLRIFHHADIGLTKEWGQPVFTKKTKSRLKKWASYSDIPLIKGKHFLPDLILIDGRFRVACALKSVKYLHDKVSYTILVDDYVGRSAYSEIEHFADLVKLEGRMAVFKQKANIDFAELDKAIAKYEAEFS